MQESYRDGDPPCSLLAVIPAQAGIQEGYAGTVVLAPDFPGSRCPAFLAVLFQGRRYFCPVLSF